MKGGRKCQFLHQDLHESWLAAVMVGCVESSRAHRQKKQIDPVKVGRSARVTRQIEQCGSGQGDGAGRQHSILCETA
jgi:hypothetical protein